MVLVRDGPAARDRPTRPTGPQWPLAPLAVPGSTHFLPQRETPAATGGQPIFRCGHCLAPVPMESVEAGLRCPACGQRNGLPARVWVCCDHCGFEQQVRTRLLKSEPRCVSCGQVAMPEDVIMTRLVRHRRRVASCQPIGHARHTHHSYGSRPHDRATVMMLLFAAGVLLSLKFFNLW